MISIQQILPVFVAFVTIATAQQAQLVYDKHFVEPPPHNYANQQNIVPITLLANQSPAISSNQVSWTNQQHPNIPMFSPQQQQQQQLSTGQFQLQPLQQAIQYLPQQPVQYHPQQPIPGQYPQPIMRQQGFLAHHPHAHHNLSPKSLPPGAIPVAVPTEFASRRGPIDKVMKGPKHYFPRGKGKKRRPGTPVRFMEMNRLPKPPKYPLYDMSDLGMATPPPPPIMHPMSVAASDTFPSYSHPPQRGGPPRTNKKPPPRRPILGQISRRPGRPSKYRPQQSLINQRSYRRPSHHHNNPHPSGYEHTMASSMDPQVSSPPLGRPLNYDEYMKRPSHSFTDDPWNFDPFAANYNSGMNTFAMKYNYDPLGMNSLDKTQTHLDPEQLSYPGDYHNLQDSPAGSAVGKITQLGGWDKGPETYRTNNNNGYNQPRPQDSSKSNLNGGRRNHSPNSFNVYDQSDSASMVKSESMNLNPLKLLSDANPGVEFTIESSSSGSGVGDTYKGGSNIDTQYSTTTTNDPYPAWNSYPQHSHDVYDSDVMSSSQVNNYGKTSHGQAHLNQLQTSAKYENGNYDAQTQLHTFGLSQDYIQRERPISDLSDTYNPHGDGGLSTDLLPPSETAAMFKRQGGQGSRSVRHEATPMIELEGLTLFKDILKDEKAQATRSHLIHVLRN